MRRTNTRGPWRDTAGAGMLALAVLGLALGAAPAGAGGNWNDAGVAWQPYEQGLEVAKRDKKPVCLVFYTEWCPHCTNYSGVFHDPKIVERAKDFVMIRLDKDKHAELSKKYAPDGEYIPRTYFLAPGGDLAPITAPRDQYKYFYDEHNAGPLLAAMDQALKTLKIP